MTYLILLILLISFVGYSCGDPLEEFEVKNERLFGQNAELLTVEETERLLDDAMNTYYEIRGGRNEDREDKLHRIESLLAFSTIRNSDFKTKLILWNKFSESYGLNYPALQNYILFHLNPMRQEAQEYIVDMMDDVQKNVEDHSWQELKHHLDDNGIQLETLDPGSSTQSELVTNAFLMYLIHKSYLRKRINWSWREHKENFIMLGGFAFFTVCPSIEEGELMRDTFMVMSVFAGIWDDLEYHIKDRIFNLLICNFIVNTQPDDIYGRFVMMTEGRKEVFDLIFSRHARPLSPDDCEILMTAIIHSSQQGKDRDLNRKTLARYVETANLYFIPRENMSCSADELRRIGNLIDREDLPNMALYYENRFPDYFRACLDRMSKGFLDAGQNISDATSEDLIKRLRGWKIEWPSKPDIPSELAAKVIAKFLVGRGLKLRRYGRPTRNDLDDLDRLINDHFWSSCSDRYITELNEPFNLLTDIMDNVSLGLWSPEEHIPPEVIDWIKLYSLCSSLMVGEVDRVDIYYEMCKANQSKLPSCLMPFAKKAV